MFCSYCGAQIADTAAFCSTCGKPVAQNNPQPAYQQPVYQQPAYQQPADYYKDTPEKADVNIVYPDGHNEIGVLYITQTELVFHKKSKGVLIAFGFLGNQLESGQLKLRINMSDIVSGGRTKIGLNPNVYQIVLRDGAVFKICFNNPSKIQYLARRFG